MALRIPNEGEATSLSIMLGKTAVEGLTLRLFSNNITPAETDVVGTYTEVTGGGYGAIALTAGNWTITPGAPGVAAYPEQIFNFTGSIANVYGYYVTGNTSGVVRFAERFSDGPYSGIETGDRIKVTLNVTLQDTQD